jgi:hypothetical protein
LVPKAQLQRANAWLGMGASVARLAGLVSAGAVVVWLGGGWAVVCSAAMYLAAAALAGLLPAVSQSLSRDASPLKQLAQGWWEVRTRQWLWVVIAQFSILIFAFEAFQGVLGPLVAVRELDGAISLGAGPLPGEAVWTVVLAGEAVGAILGVVASLVWRPARPILVGAALTFLAALPPLLLGFGLGVWLVVAAAVLMGFGFEVFGVLYLTTLQNEVPPTALSRVAAYDAFGSLVLAPFGAVIAAPAAGWLGARGAILWTGVVVLLVTVAAVASPGVRGLRVRPPAGRGPGADPDPVGGPLGQGQPCAQRRE